MPRQTHMGLPAVGFRAVRVCLAGGAVLCAVLFATCHAQQETPDESGLDRQAINQLLYLSDERHAAALETVRRQIADGQVIRALIVLQQIFDATEDGLIWPETATVPLSVRREAERLFLALDPEAWDLYENRYGAAARRLLEEAERLHDSRLLMDIERRFFYTAAGFQAAQRLGIESLDSGHAPLAVRRMQRLLDCPVHADRITPALVIRTAWTSHLVGQSDRVKMILERFGKQPKFIAVRPALSQLDSLPRAQSPGDEFDGNPRQPVRRPFLSPKWTFSLRDSTTELVRHVLDGWRTHAQQNAEPWATAVTPLVVDDTVFFRDYAGLRALDLHNGSTRWTYRCQSSLEQLSVDLARAGRLSASTDPQNCYEILRHAAAENSVIGTLTSDGRRVYAVDHVDLTPRNMRARSIQRIGGIPVAGTASRSTNRLIAINIHAHPNAAASPLWTVAGDIPLPVWFRASDRNRDRLVTREEFQGAAEEFDDHDINGDGIIDQDEAESAAMRDERSGELAGHYFLGPPLAANGRLYAMTESERQLNLVALEPESGRLLWKQGIAFVQLPISADTERSLQACLPVYAEGVVICPTQSGLLVGVDAANGSILWSYYYGDHEPDTARRFFYQPPQPHGYAGYLARPIVHGRRVICMPRHSTSIHCLDLHQGYDPRQLAKGRAAPIWTAPREDAESAVSRDEYVAAVTDDVVLIVGGQRCRALSMQTGRPLRLDSGEPLVWEFGMPSGRGLHAGDRYHLPLEDGHLKTLDLSSYHTIGWNPKVADPAAASVAAPGNLVAHEGIAVSVSASGVNAYPDASRLLAEVLPRLQRTKSTADDLLLAADLELALGDVAGAHSHLQAVLATETPDAILHRAETLYRELLYLKLEQRDGDAVAILRELKPLATTPGERARFLMRQADAQLTLGDLNGLLESTDQVASLDLAFPLPNDDGRHLVSAASWIPGMLTRARERLQAAEMNRLQTKVDTALARAHEDPGAHALEQFVSVYGDWPQANSARTALADRLARQGEWQRAELLLLENQLNDQPDVAAAAAQKLVLLLDEQGAYTAGAQLLERLRDDYADVKLPDGRTGREFAAQFPSESITYAAYLQRRPLDWPVRRVKITQPDWARSPALLSEALALKTHANSRGRSLSPYGSGFQVFSDRRGQTSESLIAVDTETGINIARIEIPSITSTPTYSREAFTGHFFPLGGTGTIYGVSLLGARQTEPLWAATPRNAPRPPTLMRVGPTGPSFCSFQARQHLIVTDPGTGEILWQRTDLDPNGGLNTDPRIGIIGDEQVLVVFAADRVTYTVYRTRTGEILRSGKLDADARRSRYSFGRLLYYVSSGTLERRLKCWDPADDRIVMDVPLYEPRLGRIFVTRVEPEQGDVAALVVPGHLQIIDGATGQPKLEIPFTPADLGEVFYVRVFQDDERYFVNLQSSNRVFGSSRETVYFNGLALPDVRIFGDLYAADGDTGRPLWRRTLRQSSVLALSNCRLPFLICCSQHTERIPGRPERATLWIEVLDSATGESIGVREGLPIDRIVHTAFDRDAGRLDLIGMESQIRLEFGPEVSVLSTDDEPL